ncbi:hypothetical protein [Streptomyces amakusaensis]|uniref:Uncharacterized protein n=1 Tax=Streptomyces amakusaensis TaxID=67271 RepID=A0ABW0AM54_9ACTN
MQGDPPPASGSGPRTRRTAAEKAAARDRVLADRTTVITITPGAIP